MSDIIPPLKSQQALACMVIDLKAERDALKTEVEQLRSKNPDELFYMTAQTLKACEKERDKLKARVERLEKALDTARSGFSHIGGHLSSKAESDMALYGLKGFAFDRRNEIDELLQALKADGEGK